MKIRKLNKIIRRVALGFAVAAIAAPVAQADPWFNDSSTGAGTSVPQTYGVGATLSDYLEFKGLPESAQYVYGVGATLADALDSTVGTPEPVVRPDDRIGVRGPGAAVQPAVRPDDRNLRPNGINAPVSTPQTLVRPDDRLEPRGPGAAPQASPVQIVIGPGGFDWTDAGVGAGFAFGLVLLASGMALVARRHRETSTVAF